LKIQYYPEMRIVIIMILLPITISCESSRQCDINIILIGIVSTGVVFMIFQKVFRDLHDHLIKIIYNNIHTCNNLKNDRILMLNPF